MEGGRGQEGDWGEWKTPGFAGAEQRERGRGGEVDSQNAPAVKDTHTRTHRSTLCCLLAHTSALVGVDQLGSLSSGFTNDCELLIGTCWPT